MAWIEAHQGLSNHPKAKRLSRMLNIEMSQAIGHLFLFWWWALDYAENGDLSKYDAYDIADAAGWKKDPEEFLRAMIECGPGGTYGFIEEDIDGKMRVHDWTNYSGRLVAKREQNRLRQAKARGKFYSQVQKLSDEVSKEVNSEKEKFQRPVAKRPIVNKKIRESEKDNNNQGNLSAKVKEPEHRPMTSKDFDDIKELLEVTRDEDVTNASVTTLQNTTQQNPTEQEQDITETGQKTQHNITKVPALPPQKKYEEEEKEEKEELKAKASASTPQNNDKKINLSGVIDLWNEILVPEGFNKVLKKTAVRLNSLKALQRNDEERKFFNWWSALFKKIIESDFLRESPKTSNWFTIDWLLQENNLVKIIEGNYDNKEKRFANATSANQKQKQKDFNDFSGIVDNRDEEITSSLEAEYKEAVTQAALLPPEEPGERVIREGEYL